MDGDKYNLERESLSGIIKTLRQPDLLPSGWMEVGVGFGQKEGSGTAWRKGRRFSLVAAKRFLILI